MIAPLTYVRIKPKFGSVGNIAGFWEWMIFLSYDKYQQAKQNAFFNPTKYYFIPDP